MNRKLLIRVIAPSVVIGLLLLAVCLLSAWFTVRTQRNLTTLLSQEVASLQAAQELEIRVRQLRFRTLLNYLDPAHARAQPIEEAHRNFEKALAKARQAANTARERDAVEAIALGYLRYQRELALVESDLGRAGNRADLHQIFDAHPTRHVVDPCQELVRLNQEAIDQTVQESEQLGSTVRWTLLALGVLGPLSGLVGGHGIARGLSRSIYQFSVHVHDMARHFEENVTSVTLPAGADLQHVDRQLRRVVQRVQEAAEKLQRQQREMLRAEQLAAVGQLAASVAHEIRNPLTSIKLLVAAAHRPRNPRPLSEQDLQVIHTEVDRLEQTVQSFLDFARPPAPQRCICELQSIVTGALDLVRARARQQGVALRFDPPREPLEADVDRGQFCNVLVNLFLNALDAMPGGGQLEVRLAVGQAASLSLTVLDTGSGIAPLMAQRLFEPFASSKQSGTGLGLSICKRIVEEHGGTIAAANRAEGEGEGGACFTIVLPAPVMEEVHAEAAGH